MRIPPPFSLKTSHLSSDTNHTNSCRSCGSRGLGLFKHSCRLPAPRRCCCCLDCIWAAGASSLSQHVAGCGLLGLIAREALACAATLCALRLLLVRLLRHERPVLHVRRRRSALGDGVLERGDELVGLDHAVAVVVDHAEDCLDLLPPQPRPHRVASEQELVHRNNLVTVNVDGFELFPEVLAVVHAQPNLHECLVDAGCDKLLAQGICDDCRRVKLRARHGLQVPLRLRRLPLSAVAGQLHAPPPALLGQVVLCNNVLVLALSSV
mmetsp:Transcript_30973/g.62857  ORF Transcript_30973/g.62857 Transcript_30973/m.62857 type:complete len:266 (-) Transcript_30973:485-1282(-)